VELKRVCLHWYWTGYEIIDKRHLNPINKHRRRSRNDFTAMSGGIAKAN